MADYIPNNSPYRELSGDEEEEPLTNFKVAVEAVREKEDDELADPGAIVAGICHLCRKGADFILTRLLDEKLDEKLHAIVA